MKPVIQCPECESDDIEVMSREYELYRCCICGERFSNEDAIILRDKSSSHRTKPRRYEDDDDGV